MRTGGKISKLGISGSSVAFAVAAMATFNATPAAAEECLLDNGDPAFEGVVDDALFVTPLDSVGDATSDGTSTSLACGANAQANGEASTALGYRAVANRRSTAIGYYATADAGAGRSALAVGDLSQATATGAVAVGFASQASGIHGVAVGTQAAAGGFHSVSVGVNSAAAGRFAAATGAGASASAENSAAYGAGASASALGATAIGAGATAAFEGSTAIGAGAVTDRANQVKLGGAGSSVTIGDIAASTAAQTGTIFMATVDASGTVGQGVDVTTLASAAAVAANTAAIAVNATAITGLDTRLTTAEGNITTNTTNIAANTAAIGALDTRVTTNTTNIAANTTAISGLNTRVTANTTAITALQSLTATHTSQINQLFGESAANRAAIDRANEGVAMALAMESPMLPAGTTFALSGGVGYYEDQGAGTLALSARIGENAAFSAGVGVGFDSGEIGARGGFQVAW